MAGRHRTKAAALANSAADPLANHADLVGTGNAARLGFPRRD